jgi:tetratricopeptide (TPR) repeat protein
MNPQIGFLLNKSLESLRNSNLDSAELLLKQALRLQSNNPHVLRVLGVISAQRRQYSDALKYLDSSLKVLPKNSLALSNLGNVYSELKEYNKALDAYDKSIKIDPQHEEAWSNKGNALYELQRYDEAIAHHNKALALKPGYFAGWSNKGNALYELKCLDEAITHYDKALNLKSDYHEASWNKSLCLLLQGNFDNGLPLYESRWNSKIVSEIGGRRLLDKPTWLGNESLQDKTILLYGEQGLGDFIQFCRYVKLVADLGAIVILEVPETLEGLMQRLSGVSQLVIKGEELPFFDYQCPLMSLPLVFKTSISNIPAHHHYLTSNAIKKSEWNLRLGEKRKKRIGLVWSSTSSFKRDSKRSLILEAFVKALPAEGFEYICLQKELKEFN